MRKAQFSHKVPAIIVEETVKEFLDECMNMHYYAYCITLCSTEFSCTVVSRIIVQVANCFN